MIEADREPSPHDLERYVIEEEVARGGMGAIYRAWDRRLGRHSAMKLMLERADRRGAQRFLREATLTGRLEHPGIVPVHHLGVDRDGRLFFTMKLVRGQDLRTVLDHIVRFPHSGTRKYPLSRLIAAFARACDATAYAHSQGVLHRDLKPDNIMIGSYGEVLVMDWGVATLLGAAPPAASPAGPPQPEPQPEPEPQPAPTAGRRPSTAQLTLPGTISGTVGYMPLEQLYGEREGLDVRTDVFGLGAVLYEILTLRAPAAAATAEESAAILEAEAIVPPREAAPDRDIPEALAAIAMRALATAPEARYHSVNALRQDITHYLEDRPVSVQDDTTRVLMGKLVRRHPAGTAITALTLAVLFAILGLTYSATVQERRRAESALEDYYAALDRRRVEEASRRELEAEREDRWVPLWAYNFRRGRPAGFRAEPQLCCRPHDPTRQSIPVPEALSCAEGALRLRGSTPRGGGLVYIHWPVPLDDGLRIEAVVPGGQALSLSLGGDSLNGYRAVVDLRPDYTPWRSAVDTLHGGTLSILSRSPCRIDLKQDTHILRFEKDQEYIRLWVDGDLVSRTFVPLPLSGANHQGMGLSTFWSTARVHSLRAWKRLRPATVPRLDPGRHLLRAEAFTAAEAFFADQAETLRGTAQAAEALLLLGVSQQLGGRTRQAAERFRALARPHPSPVPPRWRHAAGIQLARLAIHEGRLQQGIDAILGAESCLRDGTALEAGLNLVLTHLEAHGRPDPTDPRGWRRRTTLSPQAQRTALQQLSRLHLAEASVCAAGLVSLDGLEIRPLTHLVCNGNQLSRLPGLNRGALTHLSCSSNRLTSVADLRGLRLETLKLQYNNISDLSPLAGMPLTRLDISGTLVVDLTPLRGMPLKRLRLYDIPEADLTPLVTLPLETLGLTPDAHTESLECLRRIATLRTVNGQPVEDFFAALGEARR